MNKNYRFKLSYLISSLVLVTAAAVPLATYAHSPAKKTAFAGNMGNAHFALSGKIAGSKQAVTGSVTAVSGSSMTLAGSDGKTYTVDTSSAKLISAFNLQGLDFADVKVGDSLTVYGKVDGSTVVAKGITDSSMSGRDIFSGDVTAVSGSTLTISSVVNGVQKTYTVDVSAAAFSEGMGGSAIALAGIKTGDRVIVSGTLAGTTITATALRDFGGKSPIQSFLSNLRFLTVTSVSGSIVTGTSIFAKPQATYTVDVSSASLAKGAGLNGTAMAVGDIKTGDQLVVSGAVSGTSIAATDVRDLGSGNPLGSLNVGKGFGLMHGLSSGLHGMMMMR